MSDSEKTAILFEYVKSVDDGLTLNTIKVSVMERLLESYYPKLHFLYQKALFAELSDFVKEPPHFLDISDD